MVNIVLAFVTGLTTGGLSCLAVQGGLLASSLANQIEKDVQASENNKNVGRKNKKGSAPARPTAQPQMTAPKMAAPILAFLAAKLFAYTVLGFLLGWLGSMFQLSPMARAFLQVAIGIFMLGSALRMLNVHPIFRYFAIEPPAFIRRRIRRTAANADTLAAPVFLGLMTVLIPCGVTQAMMAAALGTANPLEGAALMFAFTLGASPVFFAVAYFATRLGARLEKNFMRFVAVVLLLLAFVSIDSGLTLAGSPLSITRMVTRMAAQPVQASQPQTGGDLQVYQPPAGSAGPAVNEQPTSAAPVDDSVITINVENTGYNPPVLQAKAGVPLKLRLVTQGVYSCSLAFVIPSLNVQMLLENDGEAYVDIPAQAPGTRMPYSCSMGMFTGEIIFN